MRGMSKREAIELVKKHKKVKHTEVDTLYSLIALCSRLGFTF